MEHYIHERTTPIVIKNTAVNINSKELGLTNHVNDPFKMSPPNSFMNKLNARMDRYYSPDSPDSYKQSILQNYGKYDKCHYVNVSTSH
jgi:hypothetical protein